MFGLGPSCIKMARGHRTDLVESRAQIRHDIFNHLTEESAYLLGLLFTDGGVTRNGRSWSISFYNTHLPLVEWVHETLGSNRRVFVDRNGRENPLYVSGVTSTLMGDTLVSLGVLPGKSKVPCRLPTVPEGYTISFLHGLIDGDGSVQLRKNPRCIGGVSLSLTFVSAHDSVVEDFACLLGSLGILSSVTRWSSVSRVAEVRVTGEMAERLCLLLYTRQGVCHAGKQAVWLEYEAMRKAHGGLIQSMKTKRVVP